MTHPGLPIRPVQPQPQPQLVPQIQLEPILAQYTFPQSAFQGPQQGNRYDANPQDRMSVSTINTWSSGSAQSAYNFLEDDTFSNPRSSIATTNSSVSAVSSFTKMARPVKPPKHDPEAGLWNDLLRVIPCDKDHSGQLWYDSFTTCLVCGFSRWHSLMLYARSIEISTFVTSMNNLRDISRVDFAGNYPIHFLMASGVGMEYFTNLLQWADSSSQNVFGQNPLHVLNPQDLLGEQLISSGMVQGTRAPSGAPAYPTRHKLPHAAPRTSASSSRAASLPQNSKSISVRRAPTPLARQQRSVSNQDDGQSVYENQGRIYY
jgi:hypothetical protein